MATAGSFCTDDAEAASNIVSASEDLSSPMRKERAGAAPGQQESSNEQHEVTIQ
ncbi:unnamed protein product, partial [Gongylonema pulchrum]|uniref:Uncharacterized protein n=1 Tax=Gongylonema pulchrum TaxID=637853 RepID=A0A183EY00_9BILA